LQATASARERPAFLTAGRGQQIWFNSKADGHSPDERERDVYGCAVGVGGWVRVLSPQLLARPRAKPQARAP
jgi:hypothetical protein